MTALIIHGHFYQPPRENPWTGEVELEPGAEPYHDWNERIHAECYAANAFARFIDRNGNVQIINNYEWLSFNFGPTLLSWLEEHHPQTYHRILAADRISAAEHSGHGNAIAQAYGHAILPLANLHDRETQVVWGIADFRYRFGREPEALWLPETACNDATMEVLIEHGMRYVILAPSQAEGYRLPQTDEWIPNRDDQIDTGRPYRYQHPDGSGRSITVFFYDGAASRAIAFERVLASSRQFVELFKRAANRGPMLNVATDGETYGHHFKFGDLCLAHAVEIEAPEAGFRITNYGEYLDQHPAEIDVRIREGNEGEGTSWSCAHGVGRWIRDCGCHTGGEPGWNQKWRTPLRTALEFLRDEAARQFESIGSELFRDPWAARNDYIRVILDHGESRDEFLRTHSRRPLSPAEQQRALDLMEMQRNSLLMFTSCGWFFSDISGIETVQILKYAARVIELMNELGLPSPRQQFLEILSEARSNVAAKGTGADIYLHSAERKTVEMRSVP
jgi:alpha-amylase/alpha-mannosidase (GH57 family)